MKHMLLHTHVNTHIEWGGGGDQYERGIYMSQSWSSASVWQNTQVPVVVNYCFDRMSLQFYRVCVRAQSTACLLFISGLRLLSLSRGESGRPRQIDSGREWERERGRGRERREIGSQKKREIINLWAAWWNAILTEAPNRCITGVQETDCLCAHACICVCVFVCVKCQWQFTFSLSWFKLSCCRQPTYIIAFPSAFSISLPSEIALLDQVINYIMRHLLVNAHVKLQC